MSIETIELWHKRARPVPTQQNLNVQLGCHFEEFVEMLDSISIPADLIAQQHARAAVSFLASQLKQGQLSVVVEDRQDFLDSMADQIVTAVGVAHCANMKITPALEEVNRSNWSKYDENGSPLFSKHGKIMKGPNYTPPNLEGMY